MLKRATVKVKAFMVIDNEGGTDLFGNCKLMLLILWCWNLRAARPTFIYQSRSLVYLPRQFTLAPGTLGLTAV
jgi:hypothetical protein